MFFTEVRAVYRASLDVVCVNFFYRGARDGSRAYNRVLIIFFPNFEYPHEP